MTKFLSEEWSAEAIGALNASDDVKAATKDVELTIQQIITGVDGGQASYWIGINDGTIEGGLGDGPDPDVTITQDYDTAVAITKAEINPQAAFMQGNLKVTGNMGKLLQHQMALQVLFPVLAGLSTEY
ncbi:MAG TPA: SCP2 sterol-binding domain-containing protein [Actinomycetota bacterium]|jgi:putative sterol carrier protein|nr:SCP2 sterol-binding domain-containing protein [Actinomycetota bacterium]